MTGMATSIGAALAAVALALGGSLDSDRGDRSTGAGDSTRIALVIDASQGRDGRELVDPRLRELDADVRLPRTSAEARTNVRYFDALGYRVIVAGPTARAAAQETDVAALRAADLRQALAARGGRGGAGRLALRWEVPSVSPHGPRRRKCPTGR